MISVFELVGKTAVSYEKSFLLLNKINDYFSLNKDEILILDFSNVEIISSSFFNGSIAPLLEKYSINELKCKISFKNLDSNNLNILNYCIDNAITFYKNKGI